MAETPIEQNPHESYADGSGAAGRVSAMITAVFGIFIVVGATRVWGSLYLLDTRIYSLNGTDIQDDRGVITLGLGVVVVVICLVRALWRIPDGGYVLIAGIASAVVLAITLWTIVDAPDDWNQEVLGRQVSEVRLDSGAYMSLASAIGVVVTVVLHYVFMRGRR